MLRSNGIKFGDTQAALDWRHGGVPAYLHFNRYS